MGVYVVTYEYSCAPVRNFFSENTGNSFTAWALGEPRDGEEAAFGNDRQGEEEEEDAYGEEEFPADLFGDDSDLVSN